MQVGTERQAGSELHAWRQFLARSTLWLGVLLLGSAAICWVAANWQDMSKVQRFAGAQTLLAVCALAAAWAGLRLRTAAGARGAIPGALLALAGILLGALLALLGQTYQTGADTWELFAWWAVLLLPWALAAASQAVWLLWTLVVNVAMVLWLGERVFSWWGLLGATYLPALIVAGLNLAMLAGWELAARRWRASTLVGPRLLAALAIGALVMSTMYTDLFIGRSYGSTTGSIAWLVVTLVLGFYYQKVRRDLVILAMLAAGVICVSCGSWGMAAAARARRLGGAAPGRAAHGRGGLGRALAARAGRRGQDGRAGGRCRARQRLGRQSVDPAPAGEPVAQVTPPATPAADAPWYVQCLLGLSAWLATLLLLLFIGLSQIVNTQEGALVAGLVLCAAGVAVLRSEAGPFWRQCGTAMAFAGELLVIFGISDSTSFTNACLFVLALAVAVCTCWVPISSCASSAAC